jgi:hypothetical protein
MHNNPIITNIIFFLKFLALNLSLQLYGVVVVDMMVKGQQLAESYLMGGILTED